MRDRVAVQLTDGRLDQNWSREFHSQGYIVATGVAMAAVWWSCDQEYEYLRECRHILFDLRQSVSVGRRHVARSVVAVAESWTLLGRPDKALPQLQTLIEKRLMRAPWCPTCRKTMRFERANADNEYPKLRHVIFVCNCGRKSDQLIAV